MTEQANLIQQTGAPDAGERTRALDPETSFIVQAPAGSGKTALLTQRYLRLLATVADPEEVVAITFTRKAAGEMRDRIRAALAWADGPEPDQAHERVTWQLARAARERDREREWGLIDHPSRMRVLTFDSFAMALTRQMPMLARFGAQPAITEDRFALYREAARRTLAALEEEADGATAIEHLLTHLDNNWGQVETLITQQLANREQWLPHLLAVRQDPEAARGILEANLGSTITDALEDLRAAFPADAIAPLMAAAAFAGTRLTEKGSASPITALAAVDADLPGTTPADQPLWAGLAELLLTKQGEPRKSVTVSQGFPAKKDAPSGEGPRYQQMKDQAQAAIATITAEAPELWAKLDATRWLPATSYAEDQWAVLDGLTTLLPQAVAHLSLVFGEQGVTDFTGIALAARDALGTPEAPTDLALTLDYRIQHLLVDEFQDTNSLQMALLHRLTAGWTPGDGRTLFLVGDPMQSIYGFRDARVGLFLEARVHGLPEVPLTPLRLSANFRSQSAVVDWVNATFPHVMPADEDTTVGAVPYSPAEAVQGETDGAGVTVHPFFGDEDGAEADQAVALAQQAPAEGTTAILVRTRNHLASILPRLRAADVAFEAVEIEHLVQRPVIQDLMALTRALAHPADRSAWLAVLRAPWAGLTLTDLHALAGEDRNARLMDRLFDPDIQAELSEEGQRRLKAVAEGLAEGLANRGRGQLARRVEGVWRALGGPAYVDRAEDRTDARVFFDHLAALEAGGDLPDPADLPNRMADLFAQPNQGGANPIQVLTMHKAKGLEFDTVIVPGLGRPKGENSAKPLVRFLERPRAGGVDLLLAPIHASEADQDAIYDYIGQIEKQQRNHEAGRLLYVTATRARQQLHLLGTVGWYYTQKGEGEPAMKAPPRTALLAHLWPAVEATFQTAFETWVADAAPEAEAEETAASERMAILRRVPADWVVPAPPPDAGEAKQGVKEGPKEEETE